MRKRLLLLAFLKRVLIGDHPTESGQTPWEGSASTVDSEGVVADPPLLSQIDSLPQSQETIKVPAMSQLHTPEPILNVGDFPAVSEEIRELLVSPDWDEVNQGLELLVSSCNAEELKGFAPLIDANSLTIRSQSAWQAVLGIDEKNQLNAAAKVAGLSGALAGVKTIVLNSVNFPDSETQLNLDLLSEASDLQELVINGIELSGLGALGSFHELRKLVLVGNSIDWDSDEDAECFSSLSRLRFLTVSSWPWEDLGPLSSCNSLEHLDLRGGELESLRGLDSLTNLRFLALEDFYSLSSLKGIEKLGQLRHLTVSRLSITKINPVAKLKELESLSLESSEPIDLSPLGQLVALQSIDIDCDEGTGLGTLALCPSLLRVKLGRIPTYKYGNANQASFDSSEFGKLMTTWKGFQTPSRKICNSYAESRDLGVFLLGINLLECLSAQITIPQFRSRLNQIGSRFGDQFLRRCYWPYSEGSGVDYTSSHPVGTMMHRVLLAGSLDSSSCKELSALLAERLPKARIR